MAVNILRGPVAGGKSQWLDENAPDDLRIDVTPLWAALRGLERDSDGKYPVREGDDPGLRTALYLKSVAIRFAAQEDIEAWTTTSSSSPEAVERLRAAGATGRTVTVDPGETEIRRRLADPDTGEVSDACQDAIVRWYGI